MDMGAYTIIFVHLWVSPNSFLQVVLFIPKLESLGAFVGLPSRMVIQSIKSRMPFIVCVHDGSRTQHESLSDMMTFVSSKGQPTKKLGGLRIRQLVWGVDTHRVRCPTRLVLLSAAHL